MFLVLVLVSLGVIFTLKESTKARIVQPEESVGVKTASRSSVSPQNLYQAQEQSLGNVSVSIVPQELALGKEARFQVTFDTHSVNLDYDFAQLAKLQDSQGNTWQATAWEGDRGGHHLQGVLAFPTLSTEANTVKLTLSGIDETSASFTWQIQE